MVLISVQLIYILIQMEVGVLAIMLIAIIQIIIMEQ